MEVLEFDWSHLHFHENGMITDALVMPPNGMTDEEWDAQQYQEYLKEAELA